MTHTSTVRTGPDELRAALVACSRAFIGIALFSGASNILMLTGSFYMLEVYDRVLASRSVPTLIAISGIAAILFLAQASIDMFRSRLLVRVGRGLEESLGARIFGVIVEASIKTGPRAGGVMPIRDLDTIRNFLSGLGPTALFDLPWAPLYLFIIFAFHPVLGVTALVGMLFLVALTILIELLTRRPTLAATKAATERNHLVESSRRNAQALLAMGFLRHMRTRWMTAGIGLAENQQTINDVAGGLGAFAKIFRMMLQSAMLGIGAYLVIEQQATAGVMIAGSILTSRALAPADLAIANWKGFVAARQSWTRLADLLATHPATPQPLALAAPHRRLTVDGITLLPPGTEHIVLRDVSFSLAAGQGLGIIGASASGKSSLARALVGIWPSQRGRVQLDGAALQQWSSEALGAHIGYLPQDVELFAGTIAQNIARFDPEANAASIIAAAKAAHVHDLIVSLPNGYETEISEEGGGLSTGQRQRVALARALFRNPFLVVLDEPNSNLDLQGDVALSSAIAGVRARGGIVIVIAHRPSAITAVDMLLIMDGGRVQSFGPKDKILSQIARPPSPQPPLRMVSETEDQDMTSNQCV